MATGGRAQALNAAAQTEALFPGSAIGHGGRGERPQRSFQKMLKTSCTAYKQEPWALWLSCSPHTPFGSPVTTEPTEPLCFLGDAWPGSDDVWDGFLSPPAPENTCPGASPGLCGSPSAFWAFLG